MIAKKNISKVFVIFLFFHLLIWTLAPTLSNENLPLDTIEALAWGSNLDWGFNKHPPLSAFIVESFYQIFGNQDWVYYFLSQIFVVFTFFVIWILSNDFFENKVHSLISVLLLEGIFFYNYTTPEFNVNVCQLPFWSLSIFYFWKSFKNDQIKDWLLFGVFAALGVLSKYLFIYLLLGLIIFFIFINIKKTFNFKCFISLIPFFVILSPHLFWLVENDYITITYGLSRTGTGEQILLDHFSKPLIFLLKQIGILIPFFVMFILLPSNLKNKVNLKDKKLLFLFSINIIPIILIFITSLFMGVKIRTMWMTPFYLFLGVFFIYLYKSKIDIKKINKFVTVFLFLLVLSPITYFYISMTETNKRTDYPGKEIARLVQNKWDNNFKNEIKIVIGDEWSAGNLSYHLYSRPVWMNSLQIKASSIKSSQGVIYTGNPSILKKVCPGVFGKINPVGYCMIGQK